jgi:hypothetical protein
VCLSHVLLWLVGWFMVFNATFNNILVISRRSVLLVEETGVSWENHRPVASHWQTSSHIIENHKSSEIIKYTWSWTEFELTTWVVIYTDCTGSCKSIYHTITTTTAPILLWFMTIKYSILLWRNYKLYGKKMKYPIYHVLYLPLGKGNILIMKKLQIPYPSSWCSVFS